MPDLMPAWEEIPDKFKHMSTARSGELDDSYGISTVWAGPVSGQE